MIGNIMVADSDRGVLNSSSMANETANVTKFSVVAHMKKDLEGNSPTASTNGVTENVDDKLKNDDVKHHSSDDDDDEDKLVINEGSEKKEVLSEPLACDPEVATTKSNSKRPVDDEDVIEMSPKRPRVEDELVQDKTVSLSQVDDSISTLKKDLEGLEVLLKQKEEEWNALLRLQKKKEEVFAQFMRKKQVVELRTTEKEDTTKAEVESNRSLIFLPDGCYSSVGGSQIPMMMMRHFLGGMASSQITTSNCESKINFNGSLPSIHNNVSVIDIHTSNNRLRDPPQVSILPDIHARSGKQLSHSMSSMKPILPKPITGSENLLASGVIGPQASLAPTGYGPQGPTVSVHHLIAAHRKDNPVVPPIRGAKRGAWRYRYDSDNKQSTPRDSDRPSSVSSSNSETDIRAIASLNSKGSSASNANNLLPMNDPSVSYKDVLLQFAQMTQTEKQPGSPQISIIPVGGGDGNRKPEPIPDSTSVSREVPMSSHGHNLESSSALAKLLMESGASVQGGNAKSPSIDLMSCNSSSPQYLTLSALLSGGTTTTVKDKPSQIESRTKKADEGGNSNPKCQGCHKSRAQFVCAGCGNQWYCSRECQVAAWEEHSEHCQN